MNKLAIAATLLAAGLSTPAPATVGEAHVEVRGGYLWGNGADEATAGIAGGYDINLGDTAFVGAEVAGDKVLRNGTRVQFSSGGRAGTNVGTNGKLFATAGYTFGDIDDPYVGAGYQHKFGQNVYGKVEYRHQFISNFGDYNTATAGVGFAF
jgi:outer membrane immunogenic protein